MKYINLQQVKKSEGNMIGSVLYSSISEYFLDAKHQQEFEEWNKNRDRLQQEKVMNS